MKKEVLIRISAVVVFGLLLVVLYMGGCSVHWYQSAHAKRLVETPEVPQTAQAMLIEAPATPVAPIPIVLRQAAVPSVTPAQAGVLQRQVYAILDPANPPPVGTILEKGIVAITTDEFVVDTNELPDSVNADRPLNNGVSCTDDNVEISWVIETEGCNWEALVDGNRLYHMIPGGAVEKDDSDKGFLKAKRKGHSVAWRIVPTAGLNKTRARIAYTMKYKPDSTIY